MPRKATVEDVIAEQPVELGDIGEPGELAPAAARPAEADPEAGWVLVRARENLVGGGRFVERGETYRQPPEAAEFMASKGWVEIVEE